MTEVERLIKKGVVTSDFIRPEIICEYSVEEKLKKTWAVNLDLYLEFTRICDKYNLRYYAAYGTLLGAIRHNGFIPWDDDMDVWMPRDDYNILIKVAPAELSEPYLLQTVDTDPCYYRTINRLVNVNTTCLPRAFMHSGAQNGIPLDIFPLDEYYEKTHLSDILQIKELAIKCSSYMKRNDTDNMKLEELERWNNSITDNPRTDWDMIQMIATKYNNEETDFYCMKVFVVGGGYNLPLRKEWFDRSKMHDFSSIKIKIPAGYDSILKTIYGDYMQFPPIEKRGLWHSGVIIDPERPYKEYVK